MSPMFAIILGVPLKVLSWEYVAITLPLNTKNCTSNMIFKIT